MPEQVATAVPTLALPTVVADAQAAAEDARLDAEIAASDQDAEPYRSPGGHVETKERPPDGAPEHWPPNCDHDPVPKGTGRFVYCPSRYAPSSCHPAWRFADGGWRLAKECLW
ncbi:MAG TPA: hypothetical protein VE987_15345 [Polyangiaceae bacterium]|nr:hypothetical protein [Polyangiaceae bacterium]